MIGNVEEWTGQTLYRFTSVHTGHPGWEPLKYVKGESGATGQIPKTGKYEEHQITYTNVKAFCVLIGPSLVVSMQYSNQS